MAAMDGAEDCASCAFSLTCPEDGADLGDGVVDDGDLFLFYAGAAAAADDDEDGDNEYVEQLVSKEASFCSSSSPDSEDADCSSVTSEDWFRQARLAAVKWILEVSIH
jgi:cyclin D5